jgi:hypothetical protein
MQPAHICSYTLHLLALQGFPRGWPGPANYSMAMAALSAGVKSVNPALTFAPGGFMLK